MRPNMSRVFIAGCAGTMFITLMTLFVSPWLRGGPMDNAALIGGLLDESWIWGIATHLFMGMVFLPAVYGPILYRWLPGGPTQRGMTFGLMLWLISQIVVVPALGGGFFSVQTGGLTAVVGSLLGNLAYGLILGFVAGGPHERRSGARRAPDSKWAMRRAG